MWVYDCDNFSSLPWIFFLIHYSKRIVILPTDVQVAKSFLKIFSRIYKICREVFPNISIFFFSKFQQILSTQNLYLFLIFAYFLDCIPVLYWHFIHLFCKYLKFFFKDLFSLDKVTVEICQNFYSGLFKNSLCKFPKCF